MGQKVSVNNDKVEDDHLAMAKIIKMTNWPVAMTKIIKMTRGRFL